MALSPTSLDFKTTWPPLVMGVGVFTAALCFAAIPAEAQTPQTEPTPPAPATPDVPTDLKPDTTEAPSVPADAASREQARRHFRQGVALYEEGNYTGALAEFQAAYDLTPAAAILYNIGLTHKALYRYPEAIGTLERYLAEGSGDPKLTADRRSKIQQLVAEMNSLLAPTTFVLFPPDARMVIDGRELLLPADNTALLAAGTHAATVTAEGHLPERREFSVVAGSPLTLEFRLEPVPRTGILQVRSSQPNTQIAVDGDPQGMAPLKLELFAGGHQLEARALGYETQRHEIVLAVGQERVLDLEMRMPPAKPTPFYGKWWFWTSVGAAVAAGTVAAFVFRPGIESPYVGGFDPGGTQVDR